MKTRKELRGDRAIWPFWVIMLILGALLRVNKGSISDPPQRNHGGTNRGVRFFFLWLFFIGLSAIAMFWFANLKIATPTPLTVNESVEDAIIFVDIEALSPWERTLRINARYQLTSFAVINGDERDVRIWITRPYVEQPVTGGIIATPFFGMPIPRSSLETIPVTGVVEGDSRLFPFDSYSASIGEQNDFDNSMPFRFVVANHIPGFQVKAERGGDHTVNIVLGRDLLTICIIPFAPWLVLMLYTTWVVFSWGRHHAIIANVALFISIIALRDLVVPDGVPLPCIYDVGLVIPLGAIVFGMLRSLSNINDRVTFE
ncbi:MAG: hypothetical protein TUN42_07505 [Dehalogenimonas sp.]